jgi:hypothetical protein
MLVVVMSSSPWERRCAISPRCYGTAARSCPNHPAPRLLTCRVYRISHSPMYAALTLAYLRGTLLASGAIEGNQPDGVPPD